MINRDKFISELILREHIRNRILKKHQAKIIADNKIRNVVRNLLNEAEQGEAPAESTGINVLADLLKKIVPTLEDGYKIEGFSNRKKAISKISKLNRLDKRKVLDGRGNYVGLTKEPKLVVQDIPISREGLLTAINYI